MCFLNILSLSTGRFALASRMKAMQPLASKLICCSIRWLQIELSECLGCFAFWSWLKFYCDTGQCHISFDSRATTTSDSWQSETPTSGVLRGTHGLFGGQLRYSGHLNLSSSFRKFVCICVCLYVCLSVYVFNLNLNLPADSQLGIWYPPSWWQVDTWELRLRSYKQSSKRCASTLEFACLFVMWGLCLSAY